VYIPDIATFCDNTYFDNYLLRYVENIYTVNYDTGKYEKLDYLDLPKYNITTVPKTTFQKCTSITGIDATSLTDIPQ
jgi:hypothetical protein